MTLEFLDDNDDDEGNQPSTSIVFVPSDSHLPRCFASFGEFASSVLGITPAKSIFHILWEEKTSITTVLPSPSQQSMVFCLVDPEPFMPLGAQRRVVHGRPIMRRVVIGHVPQRNNDLAITYL